MKNNLKYRLSALLFLASALTMTSCSDWTDVESLQLNTSYIRRAESSIVC